MITSKGYRPGQKCCYCEMPLTRANFSREHVRPKSKGGKGLNITGKNVLPCCKECNYEKSNMYLNEYIGFLSSQEPTAKTIIKINNARKLLQA